MGKLGWMAWAWSTERMNDLRMDAEYRSGLRIPGLSLRAVEMRRIASDTTGDPAPCADAVDSELEEYEDEHVCDLMR